LVDPLINVINYYLIYTAKPFGWRTVITYSIDMVQGYIAWLLIRAVILYLDKKLSALPLIRIAQIRLLSSAL
jgi:hypothetical protein